MATLTSASSPVGEMRNLWKPLNLEDLPSSRSRFFLDFLRPVSERILEEVKKGILRVNDARGGGGGGEGRREGEGASVSILT